MSEYMKLLTEKNKALKKLRTANKRIYDLHRENKQFKRLAFWQGLAIVFLLLLVMMSMGDLA